MQIPLSEIFKTIPTSQGIILSSQNWNFVFHADNKSNMAKYGKLIFDTDRDTFGTMRDDGKDCLRIWFDTKEDAH